VKESVGFRWDEGKWLLTKFRASQYIARKYSEARIARGESEEPWKWKSCSAHNLDAKASEHDGFRKVLGCYSISELGDGKDLIFPVLCEEHWSYHDGKWHMLRISCYDGYLRFQPNGFYGFASAPPDVVSAEQFEMLKRTFKSGGSKIESYIEHGVCSVVSD
jgi:hypothetical protein